MKASRAFFLLCLFLPFVTGCAGCRNELQHLKSDMVGLNRTITLYAADGSVIKTWTTTAKVEDRGGSCYFLDTRGKSVIVAGNFVIQEN